MMKVINRFHSFENILDQVRQNKKWYYLYHEKTPEGFGIRVKRTPKLDKAFLEEDWEEFKKAEAQALGGEYISF